MDAWMHGRGGEGREEGGGGAVRPDREKGKKGEGKEMLT